MSILLDVRDVSKRFGGLVAVNNVTFQVEEKSIASVIGPNGAGKTTFFNLVTGIFQPDSGSIAFNGKNLIGLRPDQVVSCGIARTFQNIRLFAGMSVLENVLVGRHTRLKTRFVDALFKNQRYRNDEADAIARAHQLLQQMGLDHKANELASNLSYGQQRRLEIARALATDPKLILLDEPAAGMNPQETHQMIQLIKDLRDVFNVTVVLIEHDMKLVMTMSDRVTVLCFGEKIAEGLPHEIRSNPQVIEQYMGKGKAAGAYGSQQPI